MLGDERKRYCGDCKLNVYNLSGMTRTEAENLILNHEGRLCVRFYRREDGSVLTKDCPVGWQAIKRRISRTAAAFASLLFALLGGLGVVSAFKQIDGFEVGRRFLPIFSPTPDRTVMGNISSPISSPTPKSPEMPMMGAIAAPTPKSTPKATPKPQDREEWMGKAVISKN